MDILLFIGWILGLIGFLIAGASHVKIAQLKNELKEQGILKRD